MWCSKWKWNRHPISLQHLVICILVLLTHHCLFSSCWFLVIRPQIPSHCLLSELCSSRRPQSQGRPCYPLGFPVSPEIRACDSFTPGLGLAMGGGSFSENQTVEKWPFLTWSFISEGLDQKKRTTSFGVHMTAMGEVTSSKGGSAGEKTGL